MKKRIAVIGLGLLLASSGEVAAEQPPVSGAGMLAEVVVTASRTAETVDESLAAVSVITRQDIERGQFRTLPEALSTVPGLQFSRSGGGIGQLADVYLRGTDSNHTLVLVDGIRMGSATNGRASLQHIPLSQIERIEVVRGPRSTLYGADAIGGVIQIITRRGGEKQSGNITIGGGSHGSHELRSALTGSLGASHYSLALGYLGASGFDVMRNGVADPWGWPTANEPDQDGYRETSGSLRLGHRFSPGNEVELHALHSSGTTEYDGDWQNETDFRQQVLGLTARLRPLDFWDITLSGGQSRDDGKNLKDGAFASNFDTKRGQLGWQNDFILGDHQLLTAGIDYHEDKVASSTAFARESRDTTGLYLQHRLDYGNHGLLLGLRYEDNEQFGNHTTYNLGYGLRLPRNLRLTLNYGTAFRAPTFNELYWPFSGNPNLEPEESKSYEAALQQQYGGGYWRLGVFRTEIDNLIAGWPAANINQARIDGLELESGHRIGQRWQLGLNLTLLDPENRETGRQLPRRSQQMATINLDGDFGRWRAGLTAQGYSSRYDDSANTIRVPGYVAFALRAEYDIRDNLLLQGKIENLLDHEYHEVATYNTPGRVAFATLTYSF